MGRAVLNAAFKETAVSLFDDWCAEKTADGKVVLHRHNYSVNI